MSITSRSIVIASALIVVSVAIYRYSDSFTENENTEIQHDTVFSANNFDGNLFSKEGVITQNLKADKVDFFIKQKRFEFDKPFATFFDYSKNPKGDKWFLKSDFGKVFLDDKIVLNGNVEAYPEAKDATIKKAETTVLNYDLNKNIVYSAEKVTIYGENWVDVGTNFTADLNTNQVKYEGKPNVTYYPKQD